MLSNILNLFSYTFMVRALIVGIIVSLCSALLGVILVLRRYSMIGDGLAHLGFGTLSIAIALNFTPLTFSIPIIIVSSFLLLRINQNSTIKGDAAIALISTSALAIGVAVTSLTTGLNIDVHNYMFGSILAMTNSDVYISVILGILVIVLFVLFYNRIFTITFDDDFAKATGIKTNLYNSLIAFLTSITVVIGMRMMGTMLISSLIIFPALSSMRIFKTFKSVIISSAIISIICFLIGIIVSYLFIIPVGASIVITNLVIFTLFVILSKMNK